MHALHAPLSGLNSIRLHGSYNSFRDRSVAIPCDSYTYVGGENAIGKTSLIALLPVFYGRAPESLIPRSAGKMSFMDYYLPTEQSMIVFEYTNDAGQQSVVLHRGDKGSITYRFIQGASTTHLFSPEGIARLSQGHNVKTMMQWLKQLDITVSRQITTILDYQAIIQRSNMLIRRNPADRERLRSEAAQFGLGDRQTDLTHIEKMASGMISRDRLMDSLKDIITEGMLRNVHIGDKPDMRNMHRIFDDISVLQSFKKHLPRMTACISSNQQRLDVLSDLKALIAQTQKQIEQQHVLIEECRQALQTLRNKKEALEREIAAERDSLNQQISVVKAQIGTLNKQLDLLHSTFDQYAEQNMDLRLRRYHDLPQIKQQLQQHDEVLHTLTEVTSKHDVRRMDTLAKLQSKHDAQLNQLRQHYKTAQVQLSATREKANEALLTIQKDQQQAVHDLQTAHQQQTHDLALSLQQAKSELALAGPTPEELTALSQAQDHVETGRATLSELEQTLRNTRMQDAELGAAIEHLSRQYQQQQSQRDRAIDERKRVVGFLHPKEGSLLAELHGQDPIWRDAIGKVITADLLERTDLSPRYSPDNHNQTIFGWSLDLERIETPEHLKTEDKYRVRIAELDDLIARLDKEIEKTEKDSKTTQRERQAISNMLHQQQSQVNRAREALNQSKAALDTLKSANQHALQQRQTVSRQRIEQFQKQIATLQREQQDDLAGLKKQQGDFRMEKKLFWDEQIDEILAQISVLDERETTLQREFKQHINDVEKAYQQALEKDGVDPNTIRKARDTVNSLRQQINDIQLDETEVLTYQRFLKEQWPERDTLQDSLSLAMDQDRELNTKKRDATTKAETARNALQQAITSQSERKISLEKALNDAQHQLQNASLLIDKSADNTPHTIGEPKELLALPALSEALLRTAQILRELSNAVKKSMSEANTILSSASSGSRLAQQYYNRVAQRQQQEQYDPYSDEELFASVSDLADFIQQDLPQMEDAILSAFRVEANLLASFQENLGQIVSTVKSASRQLKQILNREQLIEMIKDIDVHVTTKFEQDDGWKPLTLFTKAWRDRQADNALDLHEPEIHALFKSAYLSLDNLRVEKDFNSSMVDIRLGIMENGRMVNLYNNADIKNVSSTGISYLLSIVLYIAMTRYFCKADNVRIAWPLDELDNIDAGNFSNLLSMLDKNNMYIVTASPQLHESKMWAFNHKIFITRGQVNLLQSTASDESHYLSGMFGEPSSTGDNTPGSTFTPYGETSQTGRHLNEETLR